MPSSQNSTGPSPCQEWLDLPGEGHPGSPGLSFFFLDSISLPAVALPKRPAPPLVPFLLPRSPSPSSGRGCAVSVPAKGHGGGGGCVCVFVTVAKTLLYLAVRGCFRWVSGMGDKERKSRPSSSSGSSRGGGGRAGPHLLAGCRGNGRHRGPSSPRQSKQDRWAWAWRD